MCLICKGPGINSPDIEFLLAGIFRFQYQKGYEPNDSNKSICMRLLLFGTVVISLYPDI